MNYSAETSASFEGAGLEDREPSQSHAERLQEVMKGRRQPKEAGSAL